MQNKISQHPFDLNYRGLQARYPQIRKFVKTDCRDDVGLADLRRTVRSVIKKMPEVQMKFPADWFAVKERLESMSDEFMSYEQFQRLCGEEGVQDETDRDTLSVVLHCLGIALNYRDDSRLRETSVLKPEWVTQGIYRILNAPMLAKRQGELFLRDLREILPQDRYPPDKHLFLLELMRKFSLCFAFPDDRDRYLIPELLGKEEPLETRAFAPSDCLNFEYHYGILPEGLIPRFIVRSHTLSRGKGRWRSGTILAHKDCLALVTAIPADRRVIVRVQGGDGPYASCNRSPRLVAILERRDRSHVWRKALQLFERSALPVARPEHDGNHRRLTRLMTFHRALHLLAPAVLGGKKVGADEQEDDLRSLQTNIDFTVPLRSGKDLPVMPDGDHAEALQQFQMRFQFIAKRFVLVRVAEEDRFRLGQGCQRRLTLFLQVNTVQELVHVNRDDAVSHIFRKTRHTLLLESEKLFVVDGKCRVLGQRNHWSRLETIFELAVDPVEVVANHGEQFSS